MRSKGAQDWLDTLVTVPWRKSERADPFSPSVPKPWITADIK